MTADPKSEMRPKGVSRSPCSQAPRLLGGGATQNMCHAMYGQASISPIDCLKERFGLQWSEFIKTVDIQILYFFHRVLRLCNTILGNDVVASKAKYNAWFMVSQRFNAMHFIFRFIDPCHKKDKSARLNVVPHLHMMLEKVPEDNKDWESEKKILTNGAQCKRKSTALCDGEYGIMHGQYMFSILREHKNDLQGKELSSC